MLKLIQTDNGVFDLAHEDPNATEDEAEQTALETLVNATLHTDQIAPEGRVADQFDQRGWWYDKDRGTGLWYVRRQALGSKARQEAINMVRRALEAKSEALSDIVITDLTEAGNVSSVILNISGVHNGRKFNLRSQL
ncbi:MAG: phage GP46 family protein [Methylotenera sp.]|nr:phage GP46 family protein [Methylotenera sp.]